MGMPGGVGRHGLVVAELVCGCGDVRPRVSVMESFRFAFGRAAVCGGDVGGGRGMAGGGRGMSGKDGSGYCTTSSLNGPQK